MPATLLRQEQWPQRRQERLLWLLKAYRHPLPQYFLIIRLDIPAYALPAKLFAALATHHGEAFARLRFGEGTADSPGQLSVLARRHQHASRLSANHCAEARDIRG